MKEKYIPPIPNHLLKCEYCEIKMQNLKEIAEHYIEVHPRSRKAGEARYFYR